MNYYLVKVFNKLKLLKKINTIVTRQINGAKIHIPLIQGIGFDNLNISEFWMCELLKKIIPLKPGAFIDVGVNLGQTLIKLRTVNNVIDYIGFEPNPACVYYSNELIKDNEFVNCRLLPVGLYNDNTVLQLNLYSNEETDSAASLVEDFRPNAKIYHRIYVPVNRFEQVSQLLGVEKIAIIKIDVEGAELEVLQSLQSVVRQHRPMLIMEILPCYSSENKERIHRQQKLEAILEELDYQIIRVLKTSDEKNIDQLMILNTIGIHDNMQWCEYLLVPKELTSTVIA
jgi:FkbM family methyltransferase